MLARSATPGGKGQAPVFLLLCSFAFTSGKLSAHPTFSLQSCFAQCLHPKRCLGQASNLRRPQLAAPEPVLVPAAAPAAPFAAEMLPLILPALSSGLVARWGPSQNHRSSEAKRAPAMQMKWAQTPEGGASQSTQWCG